MLSTDRSWVAVISLGLCLGMVISLLISRFAPFAWEELRRAWKGAK